MSRLYNLYQNEVVNNMIKHFGYSNKFAVPKITKVVLSMGVKKEEVPTAIEHLTVISGQKAIKTKAKKSVAQFSIRKGFEIGAKVTLRNKQIMYGVVDRLANIALLRWRAFFGLRKNSFNNQKRNISISIGLPDSRLFHEVKSETIKNIGLNFTICTNAKKKEEAKILLEMLGLPFKEAN